MGPGADNGPVIDDHDFGGTATVAVVADIFDGACNQGSGKGKWTDGGYNVGADATCQDHNIHDVDTGGILADFLGALAGNGGPTPTISLVATGAPPDVAIGIIPDPTTSLCRATDQRGYTSAVNERCDAGAYQTTGVAGTQTPQG
jgi:hypothetical protein